MTNADDQAEETYPPLGEIIPHWDNNEYWDGHQWRPIPSIPDWDDDPAPV